MQMARKSTGGKKPRQRVPTASDRFRGVPSLKTCEVPVLEVQTTKATIRSLRTRKVESDELAYTTKEVPREGPFNFMKLPPEIRVKIYELCVPVTEYITYHDDDYCTCGGVYHHNQSRHEPVPNCTYIETSDIFAMRNGFSRRQPGRFYMVTPHYIVEDNDDIIDRWRSIKYTNARMTPRPGILRANSLIRQEALPVFYKMNDFVFEDCESSWVTRWLYNVVQPEHLKYIKSITWDGPLSYGGEEFHMEDNTFGNMSSIIMLQQLGGLGDCKIRLTPEREYDDVHFPCILHGKISDLIERKGLTLAHAENEKSVVDEHEVDGLAYCTARKLSGFCRELNEWNKLDYLPSGLGGNGDWKRNCDCKKLHRENKIAWLGMKSLVGADGSA